MLTEKESGYIFTQAGGTPIYPSSNSQIFDKFIKELGLVKRSFHALRHAHATELLRQGHPDYLVAKRLSEEVATVLNTYAHPKSKSDNRLAHAC